MKKERLHRDFVVEHLENYILPDIVAIHENPKKHKQSGYLTILRKSDGRVLLITEVGECPPQKVSRYFTFSLEKAKRLFHHPRHLSSWQSRDPGAGKRGGAIVAGDIIVSFSGLPELLDEAVVLALSVFLRWLSYDDAIEIAGISNNQFYNYLK